MSLNQPCSARSCSPAHSARWWSAGSLTMTSTAMPTSARQRLDDAGDPRRRRHVLAGRRRREQLQRRLAIPLPARVGQQLARARRIVRIGDDVRARAPDVGRQRADRRDAQALVDELDQRLAPDRVRDRAPDARIVQRPPLRVHRQVRHQRRRRHRQPQIGVQAHQRQVIGRQLLDHVGGARLQRLQPLPRVGHRQQHEVARAAPADPSSRGCAPA